MKEKDWRSTLKHYSVKHKMSSATWSALHRITRDIQGRLFSDPSREKDYADCPKKGDAVFGTKRRAIKRFKPRKKVAA